MGGWLKGDFLPRENELTKLVRRVQGQEHKGYFYVFDKFLDVCEAALKRVGDDKWKPLIEGYKSESIRGFSEGLGILLLEAIGREDSPTYRDLLGETYEELAMNDRRHFAQFFTPWHVASFMAMACLGDDLDKYTPEKPMKILDPTCGSGRLLLAAAANLPRKFIDEGRVVFYGVDLDLVCVKMAGLNMRIYGLCQSCVKNENALKPEEKKLIEEAKKTG